jgi:hypothetical protein
MRSANIITVAGATVAAAGALNTAIVPSDGSRHINTILTYSPRLNGPRTSASVVDRATVHSCTNAGTCDDATSVSEIRAAPLESTTHCICFSDANSEPHPGPRRPIKQEADSIPALAARAPNDTSTPPPEVTGGAIPQQMQASMAGLLGFFIMCLVML